MVTTPNLYSLETIISFISGHGFNNPYSEFEKLHSLGHMGHIRVYSTKEVTEFFSNAGFETVSVEYKVYSRLVGFKYILNPLHSLLPKFRPYQAIIFKKSDPL